MGTRGGALAAIVGMFLGCAPASPDAEVEAEMAVGEASLAAGLDDPLLLTVTAPPERSHYFVDEGYTLVRDPSGVPVFRTDTAGDLALAFEVDGRLVVREAEHARPVEIAHTQRDAIVIRMKPSAAVTADVTIAAVTSRAGALEVKLTSADGRAHDVRVVAALRRCDGGLLLPSARADGFAHELIVLPSFGGSVETFVGTLVSGKPHVGQRRGLLVTEAPHATRRLVVCSDALAGDLERLSRGGDAPLSGLSPVIGAVALDVASRVAPGSAARVRFDRVVSDAAAERGDAAAKTSRADDELARGRSISTSDVVAAGRARMARIPSPPGLTREERFLLRSSVVLLDGLVMRPPAEEGGWIAANGKLRRSYFLFGREPSWNFSDLGMHVHESLAARLLARLDPGLAVATQRNFIDVEKGGFVPYSAGPVVQQSFGGTIAAAPLFSFEALALADAAERAGDRTFVAEAYHAGARIHAFWELRRDRNENGLVEWGEPGPGLLGVFSGAQAEALRDIDNVIYREVIGHGDKIATAAAPMEVEALDANVMLVEEERSLAALARRLGKDADAARWDAQAGARAARVNEILWDDETGFYYHAAKKRGARAGNVPADRFDFAAPHDLRRREIQGFLPLWAGIVPPARLPRLLAHLTDPRTFWRANGVPGLAADDPFYRADAHDCCLWNGPVWVPWNWLIARGLHDAGREDLARELTAKVAGAVAAELRRSHQFREHYDPDDVRRPNASMGNYIWSALVGEMILERH